MVRAVSEKSWKQEQDLRFEKRTEVSQVIEEAETDSEQHVDDSEDNGHLHLEGIQECQLVGCDVPYLKKRKTIRVIEV